MKLRLLSEGSPNLYPVDMNDKLRDMFGVDLNRNKILKIDDETGRKYWVDSDDYSNKPENREYEDEPDFDLRLKKDMRSNMPSMHEIPHMDGTHGNVPSPGKPKWFQ